MQTFALPLSQAPTVRAIGHGAHGPGLMRYRLTGFWQLHLYPYGCRARIAGQDLDIRPGHAGITPPGADMIYQLSGGSTHLYVHFEAAGTTVPTSQLTDLAGGYSALENLLAEAAGWQERQPARAAARLWDVLWRVTSSGATAGEDRLVADIRDRIEARLGARLRVATLARQCGISHSQLDRRFRAVTGGTVVTWIRARRAARALHLLRCSDLPAAAIAQEVGIGDVQALNKLLHRFHGAGPRVLRGRGP